MAEHIWTLYIITYTDIQFNGRLVKTQHIISDSHNYFIYKILVKGLGDGMVCSPRGAVRVHPQSSSTTRERYRITSIPSMHRAGAPRGPSPNPPVLPGRGIGGLYGLLAGIGGLE